VARTPPGWRIAPDSIDASRLRAAIRGGSKIRLTYRDEQDRVSERIVWPVAIGYLDASRLLAAWCELREDFRSFRLDRIVAADVLEERYPVRPAALRAQWLGRFRDGAA